MYDIIIKRIKEIEIPYYIEAIDTFRLTDILKIESIGNEEGILLLTDKDQYNKVMDNIAKIEKVAIALKDQEIIDFDIFEKPMDYEEINKMFIDECNKYIKLIRGHSYYSENNRGADLI